MSVRVHVRVRVRVSIHGVQEAICVDPNCLPYPDLGSNPRCDLICPRSVDPGIRPWAPGFQPFPTFQGVSQCQSDYPESLSELMLLQEGICALYLQPLRQARTQVYPD